MVFFYSSSFLKPFRNIVVLTPKIEFLDNFLTKKSRSQKTTTDVENSFDFRFSINLNYGIRGYFMAIGKIAGECGGLKRRPHFNNWSRNIIDILQKTI